MIGSFHESMISSRHFSTTGDNNIRNSIDENSSYDELLKVRRSQLNFFLKQNIFFVSLKEIMILRKEREQDKQTIKLLQEQMV